MVEFDRKMTHDKLMNWGRAVHDGWLEHHLLVDPPPTSKGYLAPIVGYDEPDPPKVPVDEFDAMISEHVVVSIGCEQGGFFAFRVLVHWYTRLAFLDCTQDERFKRLSKHMKCGFQTATLMLDESQKRYFERRRVIDGLLKHFDACKISKNCVN